MRGLRLAAIGLAIIIIASTQSCSIYMAEKRPFHRDVNVLQPGAERSYVLQELGLPDGNYQRTNGGQVDIYRIAMTSETTGSKLAWSTLNVVADLLTLFMWEAVATPAELATKPEVITYVVSYGVDNKIQEVSSFGPDQFVVLPP